MLVNEILLPLLLAIPASDTVARANDDDALATRVYRVEQTVTLSDISAGTSQIRWWIAIPDDDRHQDLLDFTVVSAPGTWRIERDADRGNRFLYVEVEEPSAKSLDVVVQFTLRREGVHFEIDPARVGLITAEHARLYADEVARDAPNMAVTDRIQAIADEACGAEKNPALQVASLLRHVAEEADHYSKDPSKPHCGIGSAEDCLTNGGGCCTDLHSLFISLARARGIPARLQMGYRLNPKNAGKQYDPGYRCWAEYFLPGYGWVPADIVEADAPGGLGHDRWFTGLTEWRLWLNEGREFRLRPGTATGAPVNTMIIGYAELDGRPARVLPLGKIPAQFSRTIRFDEI